MVSLRIMPLYIIACIGLIYTTNERGFVRSFHIFLQSITLCNNLYTVKYLQHIHALQIATKNLPKEASVIKNKMINLVSIEKSSASGGTAETWNFFIFVRKFIVISYFFIHLYLSTRVDNYFFSPVDSDDTGVAVRL